MAVGGLSPAVEVFAWRIKDPGVEADYPCVKDLWRSINIFTYPFAGGGLK